MTSQQQRDSWVVRSDFTDDSKWRAICNAIKSPRLIGDQPCFAYVKFLDDTRFDSLGPLDIVHSLPDDYPRYFVFIVDTKTIAESEHPILVVNFLPFGDRSYATPPRQRDAASLEMFRAIPATIQSIENNLSIGNMGFEEFAESVEANGVFRGDV
jgi:hypothetical protein